MVREDVAHIAVKGGHRDVARHLRMIMAKRGYSYCSVEDGHLLQDPNWKSPFKPPPEFRCFLVLEDRDGWTTVTDELDLLEEQLASELSIEFETLAVRGHFETGEYEYQAWSGGRRLSEDEIGLETRRVLNFIQKHSDHVTKFPYDEVILRREDLLDEGRMYFVGFRRSI